MNNNVEQFNVHVSSLFCLSCALVLYLYPHFSCLPPCLSITLFVSPTHASSSLSSCRPPCLSLTLFVSHSLPSPHSLHILSLPLPHPHHYSWLPPSLSLTSCFRPFQFLHSLSLPLCLSLTLLMTSSLPLPDPPRGCLPASLSPYSCILPCISLTFLLTPSLPLLTILNYDSLPELPLTTLVTPSVPLPHPTRNSLLASPSPYSWHSACLSFTLLVTPSLPLPHPTRASFPASPSHYSWQPPCLSLTLFVAPSLPLTPPPQLLIRYFNGGTEITELIFHALHQKIAFRHFKTNTFQMYIIVSL